MLEPRWTGLMLVMFFVFHLRIIELFDRCRCCCCYVAKISYHLLNNEYDCHTYSVDYSKSYFIRFHLQVSHEKKRNNSYLPLYLVVLIGILKMVYGNPPHNWGVFYPRTNPLSSTTKLGSPPTRWPLQLFLPGGVKSNDCSGCNVKKLLDLSISGVSSCVFSDVFVHDFFHMCNSYVFISYQSFFMAKITMLSLTGWTPQHLNQTGVPQLQRHRDCYWQVVAPQPKKPQEISGAERSFLGG